MPLKKNPIARAVDSVAAALGVARDAQTEHAKLVSELADLDADLDRRSAQRRSMAETADEAALAAFDRESAEVEARRNRVRDLANGRAARLAAAQADAAEARRRAAYEDAMAATNELAGNLAARYHAAATALRDIIDDVEANKVLVAQINANLPAGTQPLVPAENLARDLPPREREIVRERRVSVWVYRNGDVVPEEIAATVIVAGDGSGRLPAAKWSNSGTPVYRRTVLRREIVEAHRGHRLPALSASVSLPPVRAGELSVWDAQSEEPARNVAKIAALREAEQRPPKGPETVIEHAVVDRPGIEVAGLPPAA